MWVLLITLVFGTPAEAFKSPPFVPVFQTEEDCKKNMEEITDQLKKATAADHVVYQCVEGILLKHVGSI